VDDVVDCMYVSVMSTSLSSVLLPPSIAQTFDENSTPAKKVKCRMLEGKGCLGSGSGSGSFRIRVRGRGRGRVWGWGWGRVG